MTLHRTAAALVLALTSAAFAQSTQPASRPARPPAAPNGLGAAMKDMERVFTTLTKEAADPDKRDESLHNVAILQRDAAIAKLFAPPMIRKAPADQKAKLTEDYRTDMVTLQKTLLDLEDAIASKNPEAIQKSLDAIQAVVKKGHAEFMPNEN